MERGTYDAGAIRFNQGSIILLVLSGYVLDMPALPAIVAAVLLAGSRLPRLALFKIVYRKVVRPAGLMRSRLRTDDPAPHDFAQLMGGTVLAAASILLFLGHDAAGWSLAWLVILLASLNLVFGFCAGCFVYFQLGRLGMPGFRKRGEGHA